MNANEFTEPPHTMGIKFYCSQCAKGNFKKDAANSNWRTISHSNCVYFENGGDFCSYQFDKRTGGYSCAKESVKTDN